MDDKSLYAAILGLTVPWSVDKVELRLANGEVHVWVALHQRGRREHEFENSKDQIPGSSVPEPRALQNGDPLSPRRPGSLSDPARRARMKFPTRFPEDPKKLGCRRQCPEP